MQMSFTPDDEAAFQRRAPTLSRRLRRLGRAAPASKPTRATSSCCWTGSVGYGDGELGRWSVPDIAEFLLEWCPRKLAAPPELCAEIPASVAAFVDFLAHTGLLAPDSQPPSAAAYCQRSPDLFAAR